MYDKTNKNNLTTTLLILYQVNTPIQKHNTFLSRSRSMFTDGNMDARLG